MHDRNSLVCLYQMQVYQNQFAVLLNVIQIVTLFQRTLSF